MTASPLVTPDLERTPVLAALAHGGFSALAASAVAPPGTALPAFVAATAGSLVAARAARGSLRLPVLVGLAMLCVGVGLALSQLLTSVALAGLFSIATTLRTAEWAVAGFGAFGVSFGLRALGARDRRFVALEILAFGAIALALLRDHRHGAIHRPLELSDPMIEAGQDPKLAFLAFGALIAGGLATLLVRDRSRLRTVLHLAVVAVLAGSCFLMSVAGHVLGSTPRAERGGEGDDEGGSSQPDDQRPSGRSGTSSGGGSGSRQVPVAVVVFHDDYSPPTETYYLRTTTFSRLEGRMLVETEAPDLLGPLGDRDVATRVAPPPHDLRAELDTTVALLSPEPLGLGLDSPVRAVTRPNPDPSRFTRVDRVTSRVPLVGYEVLAPIVPFDPSWDEATRAGLLATHPDPRYAELAARIVEELVPVERAGEVDATITAVRTWLAREVVYSQRHRGEDGPDKTSDFLFGDRIGYCVHVAHSAVFLLRALGVPARVGAGYAVPESAREGGTSMLVTRAFGHAWPEVFVEGYGWVIVDTFPERSLDPPPPPPDAELARLLAEQVRGESTASEEDPPPDVAAAIDAAIARTRSFVRAVPFFLLALLAGLYAHKLVRRHGHALAPRGARPRLAYRAALDALAEAGVRRRRGETREAFAERVASVAPSFDPLTAMHLAAAFGGRLPTHAGTHLPELARSTQRELARSLPWGRRLLCLLDPLSYLTAR